MKASVLINRSPTAEFTFSNGLRKGDPLSPFLFNIVGEVIHIMMERASEIGLIEGVQTHESSKMISHLQFADDTIIFLKGSEENMINFKNLLKCF